MIFENIEKMSRGVSEKKKVKWLFKYGLHANDKRKGSLT
jgi:hypothetical protein